MGVKKNKTIYVHVRCETKHSLLINFFNDIKPKFYFGPVAQLVRAVHS